MWKTLRNGASLVSRFVHQLAYFNLIAVYLIVSLENQVTPFSLPTVDGVDLYLWHILPLALYTQHEATLSQASRVPLDKYNSSNAFKLLKEDPEARLILSC